jgi:glutamine synthetase
MQIKYAVRNFAALNGLSATFMPKPMFAAPGNGFHVQRNSTSNYLKPEKFSIQAQVKFVRNTAASALDSQERSIL